MPEQGNQYAGMMTLEDVKAEIIEEFSVYDEWLDKYEYLIELGKNLAPYPEELKIDSKLIKGCQSRVWLDWYITDGKLWFRADSDAIITFSDCEISDLIVQDAGSPSKLMFSFEGCRIGTAYLHPLSGSPRGDTEVGFINCKIYEAQYSDILENFDEDDDPDGLLVSELWRRVYDNGSYSFTRTEIRDERYV